MQRDSDKGDGYKYDLTQQIVDYQQNGMVDLNSGTVTNPASDTNLGFDGCGNKTSQNGVAFAAPNNMNQPTDAGITYDTSGNLKTWNGYTYSYDAQNRLRSATSPNAFGVNFYYDGLNRQVARVTSGSAPFSTSGSYPNPMSVSMSTSTSGATIFYTKDGTTTPTHTGSTAGLNTFVYGGAVNVAAGTEKIFQAIAYKAGMTDSDMTSYDADNSGGMAPMTASSPSQTIVFSVWDGDWAILEEYGPSNVLIESYVQGYHGLVKTTQTNIYYYQDELGSTSHIASSTGALLEYYKYDLYGKPTFFSSTSQPLNSSTYAVKDLFTGQRWIPELGLYDDRNRFMSPDLGRFLQPDPIGFKGDGSNLYRYCGNDWASRSDPMGLYYDDPYEGQESRFNMVPTISRPGGLDRYGETPIARKISVVPVGNQLRLTRYDVSVGKRNIAEGTQFSGNRTESEKAGTKEHEDRHVADAKSLHDQYQKTMGKTIGQVPEGADRQKAAQKAADRLGNEFDAKIQSHEPRSEWEPILRKEGYSNSDVRRYYRSAPSSAGGVNYYMPSGAAGGSVASGEQPDGSFVDSQGSNINLGGDGGSCDSVPPWISHQLP